MCAELVVSLQRFTTLRETPPGPVIDLEPETVLRPPPGLTVDELFAALRSEGVVYGVDRNALEQIVREGTRVPRIVARGTPPEHGRDGRFRPVVPVESRRTRDTGVERQDPRDRYQVVSVREGTTVGYIEPPTNGRPGRDVRGRELAPRAGRPVRVICGDGVIRNPTPDGQEELRAIRSGRPVFQRVGRNTWRVDVVPLLVQEGDVNVETGHIRFKGDVVVTGNVREGMKVVATGRVHVHGYADRAYLQADGDIRVDGGVVQSRVVAGARVWLYNDLRAVLSPLRKGVAKILEAMRVVERAASFQREDIARFGPGRLVRLLIEMKFGDVPDKARAVHGRLVEYEGELDPEIEKLRRPIEALATGLIGDRFDIKGLYKALEEAEEFLGWFDQAAAGKAVIGYAHNATVYSGGLVIVGAEGTYHARIVARDRVVVQGAVVGGSVEAVRSVTVLEAGSPALPSTVLAVGPGGTIQAGYAYENVWLSIGGVQRRVRNASKNLRVTASSFRR
nr:FapA family protein [Thermaerobacter composti]